MDQSLSIRLFGLSVTSPMVQAYADECRRNEELLSEAMFITRKSADEVRAAAACSPLSFADFVQQLKAGLKI